MEPAQGMQQETYMVEEQPPEPALVTVETSDDGTTRRTETNVNTVCCKMKPRLEKKKSSKFPFFFALF